MSWHTLIEPFVPAFLAVHGAALLFDAPDSEPLSWLLIVATFALGVAGMAGWRSRRSVTIRAWALPAITVALLALSGGAPAFFTLWLFMISPVYALAMGGTASYAYPVVVGLSYLVVALAGGEGAPDAISIAGGELPAAVLWGRIAVITGTGLLVAGIAASQRRTYESAVTSKDRLVASVSHELRTPLAAVVGFTAELKQRLAGSADPELGEFAELVHGQAVEVANIVEDLLVAARSEIKQVNITPDVVDLRSQAESVVGEFEALASERSLPRISGTGTVFADPIRVRQILRNLLTNAFRYGGPQIEIRISSVSSHGVVEVVDDGSGIPSDVAERLFGAYERAGEHRDQPGSIGLGLYVSRTLAELMSGRLTYHSRPGESAFRLELPLSR